MAEFVGLWSTPDFHDEFGFAGRPEPCDSCREITGERLGHSFDFLPGLRPPCVLFRKSASKTFSLGPSLFACRVGQPLPRLLICGLRGGQVRVLSGLNVHSVLEVSPPRRFLLEGVQTADSSFSSTVESRCAVIVILSVSSLQRLAESRSVRDTGMAFRVALQDPTSLSYLYPEPSLRLCTN